MMNDNVGKPVLLYWCKYH